MKNGRVSTSPKFKVFSRENQFDYLLKFFAKYFGAEKTQGNFEEAQKPPPFFVRTDKSLNIVERFKVIEIVTRNLKSLVVVYLTLLRNRTQNKRSLFNKSKLLF